MSEQIENKQTTETHDEERELWPSPGAKIRKLREELGYSREKVSEALFITVHYVKALENDDFDKLPGLTFTKGYFKSYAEFLGADVDEILTCYQNFIKAGEDTAKQETEALKAKSDKKVIVWVLLGLFIVILLVGLTIWLSNDANAREVGQLEQAKFTHLD